MPIMVTSWMRFPGRHQGEARRSTRKPVDIKVNERDDVLTSAGGDRRYIVPDSLMLDLVNAYNKAGMRDHPCSRFHASIRMAAAHHDYLETTPPADLNCRRNMRSSLFDRRVQVTVTRIAN
jgi:hypothetical protein